MFLETTLNYFHISCFMRFCFLIILFLKPVAKRTVSIFKHGFLFWKQSKTENRLPKKALTAAIEVCGSPKSRSRRRLGQRLLQKPNTNVDQTIHVSDVASIERHKVPTISNKYMTSLYKYKLISINDVSLFYPAIFKRVPHLA